MEFSFLLKKKVNKVYLILWPPYGENNNSNIDLSIGLVFNEADGLFIITTDKEDNWTPKIVHQDIPKELFSFEEFNNRVKKWQNLEIDEIIKEENYDFTNSQYFRSIINQCITDVEWISVNETPFGVKLKFENDYIISTPISDGNTIETKAFCLFKNIDVYKTLGEIKFNSIIE
jgi:hypothetical protein